MAGRAGHGVVGVHSSFFGPAKFGIVPEWSMRATLSRANGLLNMLSNVAVITGSLVAGPLTDLYYNKETTQIEQPTILDWPCWRPPYVACCHLDHAPPQSFANLLKVRLESVRHLLHHVGRDGAGTAIDGNHCLGHVLYDQHDCLDDRPRIRNPVTH